MKKIVIIGAGPAGLTAGVEILRKDPSLQVVLLEESGDIGGISKTVNCDGNRMDLGGHRFFSKNRKVVDWWMSMLPLQGQPSFDDRKLDRQPELKEGGPDPETENKVFLSRRRVSRIYYKKHFFDYPVRMNLTTVKNLGFFTMMQAGFSYLKAVIFRRKENSLEDFYINRFGKKLYSIFFESYTEKLWGRHPRSISPDWGAQRVKGLSVLAVLKDTWQKLFHSKNKDVETSLIETFYYPKLGPGQMWETAAEEFGRLGGEIKFHCRVTGLTREGGRISRVTYKEGDENYSIEPDVVFSSMPVKDLIAGMNGVPWNVARIAQGLPYRDFVTVGLLVDRLLLQNETSMKALGNLVPYCWIYVQERSIKMGRIQIFNNWSPYMVKDAEHTVSLGLEYFCKEGDEMWNMSLEEWQEFGRKELVQMGILSPDTEVHASHCEKVKKAYPAYFDTYADMPVLREWLDGMENLYCIGRNGQHRYNNMDHSMLTAMEAVDCLFHEMKNKKAIWQVNTEQVYHEEKNGGKE